MTDLHVGDLVNPQALIPKNVLIHVTAGPHRGKKGRVRSASGDGHVLIDAHGHTSPIRVNTQHVIRADAVSGHMDTALRTAARKTRRG